MKYFFSNEKKILAVTIVLTIVASCSFLVGFTLSDQEYFFKINKSIDIFGRVYREITMNYVDEVDPEKFMEAGIDGLLGTLDPYTNFISEKEADEIELITVGKYGGIGVTIGVRDGYITILSLMEGYSAQKQGIQPGDRILEIDGVPVTGSKPENIRSMTRGEPGTELHLKVERDSEPKLLEFVVVREEIQLKNITYADFVQDGIAYIRLDRFSRGAGDELGLAIKDLKLKGPIKGVVLDLRNNPGGLLDVAVNVVEKFVTKGSLVVSTRGRGQDSEKKFFVSTDPMLPEVPLVVLVNRQSASASEIVAGAIQDLDRGIILGTRSFGKGLVQTITPLVYNTQLKITTAKYYTPSGRCIQEIDYMHKNKDGVFATTPDSLKKKFKTLNGRLELEAGGILPDTIVTEPEHSALYNELIRKSMFFKFANGYASAHKEMPSMLSDSLINNFQQFLTSQKFIYQDEVETKLKELCDLSEKCKYSESVRKEIDQLKNDLTADKEKNLVRYKDEILSTLKPEIVSRYRGEKGRIEETLKSDNQVIAAIGLLLNGEEYKHRLNVR
jgi:carboxyl-terminal processing protease